MYQLICNLKNMSNPIRITDQYSNINTPETISIPILPKASQHKWYVQQSYFI